MPTYTSSADPYWRYRQLDRMGNAMGVVAGMIQRKRQMKTANDHKMMGMYMRMMEENEDFATQARDKLNERFAEKYPMFGEAVNFYADRGQSLVRGQDTFENKFMPGVMSYGDQLQKTRAAIQAEPHMIAGRDAAGGLRLLQNEGQAQRWNAVQGMDNPAAISQNVFRGLNPQQQQDMYVWGKRQGYSLPQPEMIDQSKMTPTSETARALYGGAFGEEGSPTFEAVEAHLNMIPKPGQVEQQAQAQQRILDRTLKVQEQKAKDATKLTELKQANRVIIQNMMTERAGVSGTRRDAQDSLYEYGKEWVKQQQGEWNEQRRGYVESTAIGIHEGRPSTDDPVKSEQEFMAANPRQVAETVPEAYQAKWAAIVQNAWADPVERSELVAQGLDQTDVLEQLILKYSADIASGIQPADAFRRSLSD